MRAFGSHCALASRCSNSASTVLRRRSAPSAGRPRSRNGTQWTCEKRRCACHSRQRVGRIGVTRTRSRRDKVAKRKQRTQELLLAISRWSIAFSFCSTEKPRVALVFITIETATANMRQKNGVLDALALLREQHEPRGLDQMGLHTAGALFCSLGPTPLTVARPRGVHRCSSHPRSSQQMRCLHALDRRQTAQWLGT